MSKINGITYYKIAPGYEGDVTKRCGLTGSEVDSNFFFLRGYDIKSASWNKEKSQLVLTRVNGDKMVISGISNSLNPQLSYYDAENGVLHLNIADKDYAFEGFPVEKTIKTDDTIDGIGTDLDPLRIEKTALAGVYAPVKAIINGTENEKLPENPALYDRYVTIEPITDGGLVYNVNALASIANRLGKETSKWRIPTVTDWNHMLNALEICDEDRTHVDDGDGLDMGRYAGGILKERNVVEYENFTFESVDGSIFISPDPEKTYINLSGFTAEQIAEWTGADNLVQADQYNEPHIIYFPLWLNANKGNEKMKELFTNIGLTEKKDYVLYGSKQNITEDGILVDSLNFDLIKTIITITAVNFDVVEGTEYGWSVDSLGEQEVDPTGFDIKAYGYRDAYGNIAGVNEISEFWTDTEFNTMARSLAKEHVTKRFEAPKNTVYQTHESDGLFLPVRMVRDYDGDFGEVEVINGVPHKCVLMKSIDEYGFITKKVWTATNAKFNYLLDGDTEFGNALAMYATDSVEGDTANYINVWNGNAWDKRLINEGECVIVLDAPDGSSHSTWQVVDGELVNTEFSLDFYHENVDDNTAIIEVGGEGEGKITLSAPHFDDIVTAYTTSGTVVTPDGTTFYRNPESDGDPDTDKYPYAWISDGTIKLNAYTSTPSPIPDTSKSHSTKSGTLDVSTNIVSVEKEYKRDGNTEIEVKSDMATYHGDEIATLKDITSSEEVIDDKIEAAKEELTEKIDDKQDKLNYYSENTDEHTARTFTDGSVTLEAGTEGRVVPTITVNLVTSTKEFERNPEGDSVGSNNPLCWTAEDGTNVYTRTETIDPSVDGAYTNPSGTTALTKRTITAVGEHEYIGQSSSIVVTPEKATYNGKEIATIDKVEAESERAKGVENSLNNSITSLTQTVQTIEKAGKINRDIKYDDDNVMIPSGTSLTDAAEIIKDVIVENEKTCADAFNNLEEKTDDTNDRVDAIEKIVRTERDINNDDDTVMIPSGSTLTETAEILKQSIGELGTAVSDISSDIDDINDKISIMTSGVTVELEEVFEELATKADKDDVPTVIDITKYTNVGDIMPSDADLYVHFEQDGTNYLTHHITAYDTNGNLAALFCSLHYQGKGFAYAYFKLREDGGYEYVDSYSTITALQKPVPEWILKAFNEDLRGKLNDEVNRATNAEQELNTITNNLHESLGEAFDSIEYLYNLISGSSVDVNEKIEELREAIEQETVRNDEQDNELDNIDTAISGLTEELENIESIVRIEHDIEYNDVVMIPSGYTLTETAEKIKDVIADNEHTVSVALNNLNSRTTNLENNAESSSEAINAEKARNDAQDTSIANIESAITEINETLSGKAEKSEIPVIDGELSETSSNPVANSAITNTIIENERVTSESLNDLNERCDVLSGRVDDTEEYISEIDENISGLTQYIYNVEDETKIRHDIKYTETDVLVPSGSTLTETAEIFKDTILDNEKVVAEGFVAVKDILGTDEHLHHDFEGEIIGDAKTVIEAEELLDSAVTENREEIASHTTQIASLNDNKQDKLTYYTEDTTTDSVIIDGTKSIQLRTFDERDAVVSVSTPGSVHTRNENSDKAIGVDPYPYAWTTSTNITRYTEKLSPEIGEFLYFSSTGGTSFAIVNVTVERKSFENNLLLSDGMATINGHKILTDSATLRSTGFYNEVEETLHECYTKRSIELSDDVTITENANLTESAEFIAIVIKDLYRQIGELKAEIETLKNA